MMVEWRNARVLEEKRRLYTLLNTIIRPTIRHVVSSGR